MRSLTLIFVILLFASSAYTQAHVPSPTPTPTPCTIPNTTTPTGPVKPREGRVFLVPGTSNTNSRMLKTVNRQADINCPSDDLRVAEHVSIKDGPVGEVYLVSGLNDFIKVDAGRAVTNIYPSLIFDMSASPLYRLNDGGDAKKKRKAENTKLDLLWRDVTVTLSAFCKDSSDAKEERCDEKVSVLEVLPNATSSGQKESVPAQIASTISGLGTAAAPFFPASTFNEKVGAAGDGLTVLFRNLFPPQTQTYFHAFLGDERTFGWNYRENTVDSKNPSLLGVNRGIVLLKAPKNLVRLEVYCDIMSKWSDNLGGP